MVATHVVATHVVATRVVATRVVATHVVATRVVATTRGSYHMYTCDSAIIIMLQISARKY